MPERVLWMGAVLLLAVPIAVIGHVSSGRMKPVERDAISTRAPTPAPATARWVDGDARHAEDEDDAEPTIDPSLVAAARDLPWWMQMFMDGPGSVASGVVELGAAVLQAFADIPGQIGELVEALPELSSAVAENPWVLGMFAAAVVTQVIDDVTTVATTTKRAEAMRILGAMVADRISPGKFLAFVKKSRGAQRVASAARRVRSTLAKAHLPGVNGRRFGLALCFVAGTLVHGADRLRPIETLEVGDRIATTDLALEKGHVIDATWKRILLELPRAPGDVVAVELLRSPAWVAETGAVEGGTVRLSIPEMTLEGRARVVAIRDAPHLEEGRGHIVLATFRSTARDDVVELHFAKSNEVLGATSRHRLYSMDRDAFVPAGELHVGERLRGRRGVVVVASITRKPGAHTVYNIEVDTDHSYFVGRVGVLSHNNDPYSYPNMPGVPIGTQPPGTAATHRLVNGVVRALSPDDFKLVGPLIFRRELGGTSLLRGPSGRVFAFREVGDDLAPLARADMHNFLSRAAGLPTAPMVPAVYNNTLGILTELPRGTRSLRQGAFQASVERVAAFGDIRALDYVTGLETRTNLGLRMFEVEPKTWSMAPIGFDPMPSTINRADALALHPVHAVSDRMYDSLRNISRQRETLIKNLEPYAAHIDTKAIVDGGIDSARRLVRHIETEPVFVFSRASPYVTLHPMLVVSQTDVRAFERAQDAYSAAQLGPLRRLEFPVVQPEAEQLLRGLTPTRQISEQGMAAYREQLQLQHQPYARTPDPADYRSAPSYARQVVEDTTQGAGVEMLALVQTRINVYRLTGIDIGHPYGNPRYEQRAMRAALGTPEALHRLERELGTTSLQQLIPRGNATERIRQQAMRQWLGSDWRD